MHLLEENSMLKVRPDLFNEWDFKKNTEIGLDVYEVTKGSSKKVWWNCPKCGSNYDCSISNRVNGQSCPYCKGVRVNHTNSLATLRPDLASEWHPTKNGDLTPEDVVCGSKKKVWWLGECGHVWDNKVRERKYGGCPICSGHRVLKGFNDFNTTSEKLRELILNEGDGYKYSKGSKVKLDWKCKCGCIIKGKSPFDVDYNGLPCPICSKDKSYPEKYVSNLLRQINVEFEWEKTFEWSQNKRYDFYVPTLNMIIEVHGSQHYTQGFNNLGGKTLEEEQENDQLKEQLAKENGIEHYIVIDARYSNKEWMMKSLNESDIVKYFDLTNIDYDMIDYNSRKSIVNELELMWHDFKSLKYIINKTGLSRESVVRYLSKTEGFNSSDDIDTKREREESRTLIEFDSNKTFFRIFINDTSKNYNYTNLTNFNSLLDKHYFKKNYFIENEDAIRKRIVKLMCDKIFGRKIIQLNYNFDVIKIWEDNHQAIGKHFGINTTNLSAHLRNEQRSFAGYLWTYDDKIIEKLHKFDEWFNDKYLHYIYQFNFDGELIHKWRNSYTTEHFNGVTLNFNHIMKKVVDLNHYYKGFIFIRSYKFDKIKDKKQFFINLKEKYKRYL